VLRFRVLSFCFLLAAGCSLPPAAPGSGELLAVVHNPSAMAVDSTTIYVAQPDPGSLVAVPIGGGAPTILAATTTKAVAVYAQSLYWTDGSSVAGCDTSNCAGTRSTVAADNATLLAVDATNLYWATASEASAVPRIMKADRTGGGAPVQLATAGFPRGLAVDAQNVYWADELLGLMSVPIAGGTVRGVATSGWSMGGLALDDANVYITTFEGKLFVVPKTGGEVRTLLTDLGQGMTAVATDGRTLYVPSNDKLVKMPVTGGPVTVLASPLNDITAIVLDATNVYAADAALGDVVKVPK
jgi:hypothetical protein